MTCDLGGSKNMFSGKMSWLNRLNSLAELIEKSQIYSWCLTLVFAWNLIFTMNHFALADQKVQVSKEFQLLFGYPDQEKSEFPNMEDFSNMTQLSHWTNGATMALASRESQVYFGNGIFFQIADVSNPSRPQEQAKLSLNAPLNDIKIQGNYAYVANDSAGLKIIDISNNRSPVVFSHLQPGCIFQGLYLDDHYLYAACGSAGLLIINITDPSHPQIVGQHVTAGSARGVWVSNHMAFVTADVAGLRIFDVSNPYLPVEVGFIGCPGSARQVFIDQNLAYLACDTGGLRILDITDPISPQLIGQFTSGSRILDVISIGSYAYLAAGEAGLRILNIINPSLPIEISFYDTPGTSLKLAFSPSRIYLADGNNGLVILNVASPAQPAVLGNFETWGYAYATLRNENLLFIADGSSGVRILNVSDPAEMREIGFYNPGLWIVNLVFAPPYGFAAAGPDGLRVFDFTDPTLPVEIGSYDTPGETVDLSLYQNFLILADGYGGLRILDISTPAQPIEVATTPTTSYIYGVKVSENYAFTTEWTAGFRIYELSNIYLPRLYGYLNTSGLSIDLAVKPGNAFVAEGTDGLRLIDLTYLYSPQHLGFFNTTGYTVDVAVTGPVVYLADGFSGVRVLDVTQPASPREIAYFNTNGNSRGISASGDMVYAADGQNGAYVLRNDLVFVGSVSRNWNLLGLPVAVQDSFYLSVFPEAVPPCYEWVGIYQADVDLENGKGYWLNFRQPTETVILGERFYSIDLSLREGWNMISGPSVNVTLAQILDPSGIIVPGSIYGFKGTYVSPETLEAGKGYWIMASAAGTISINAGAASSPVMLAKLSNLVDISQNASITVSDARGYSQELYVDVQLTPEVDRMSYQLPPLPPAGSFDARFAGDMRLVESEEGIIRLQGSYPITLTARGADYVVEELVTDGRSYHVAAGSSVTISNSQLKSVKVVKSTVSMVPSSFVVEQNYPNPFNPTTTISYSLPSESKVEVIVFNALGQEVKTLVSANQPAGRYTVSWDGTNAQGVSVSSGIYYYQVSAGKKHSNFKMLYLK